MSNSRLVNRNVIAGAGRTSMRLEPELWDALREIAARERSDVGTLIRRVEATVTAGGRTSAVRVFIVQYFRAALDETASSAGSLSPGLATKADLQSRQAGSYA